jgi:uncharacterized membrane protein YoaK (UPF0700 family)
VSFLTDVRHTLAPEPGSPFGPLPPLLVGLTVVTGLVDAFSYLLLGHVFVANMTGNVVFLGFALAGAHGFSIAASLLALVAFWSGAFAGGALGSRMGTHRGRLLTTAVAMEAVLLTTSVILTAVGGNPLGAAYRYPLIALMAVGMGMQNATARRLAVPDLTTTVLTLTITGTAADSVLVGGKGSTAGRRTVSVLSMFLGALVGALLIIHVRIVLPLVLALCLLVGVAAASGILGRGNPSWAQA